MADGPDGLGPEVDAGEVLRGAHPHGYLLTTVASPPPDVAGWGTDTALVPGATLHLHPRTVVGHTHGAIGTVILLGHPVDVPAGITDSSRIASRLCGTWDLRGREALVREAAELGGRWTMLAVLHHARGRGLTGSRISSGHGTDLLVVPDTHATQPVFSAVHGGRLALGSTPTLVARTLDLPDDEEAVRLLAALRRRRRGSTVYLPGRHTAHLGVDPLMPNCLLRVDLGEPMRGASPEARQERFWPWREREETTDVAAVWSRFWDRITTHAGLLASLGDRPVVSLTAGSDSRVTVAAAHRGLRDRGGFAFTYVHPPDARKAAAPALDVTGASAVAAQLGLPHRVLRWRQPPEGGTFDVLHRRTFGPLRVSRGAAHAMWADLPHDIVQLQSICAETGTTFVTRRTDEPLSPLRMARMSANAIAGMEDLAEQMYAGYQEWAQFDQARLLGYDHHDVFYWEQRVGKWGWQKFVDGDLGHRVLLPFNDRVLIETMLSLPYEQRAAKVLYDKVFESVPLARLPRPSTPVVEAITGRLPGRMRAPVERAVERRQRRAGLGRWGWPRGYAVLPAGAAGAPGAGSEAIEPPGSWPATVLPGGHAMLHRHPSLAHTLMGDADTWVLVLGEPVGVREGLTSAAEIAARLHGILLGESAGRPGTGRPRDGLSAAGTAAAALAGSWLVVLQTPGRTVVVADPLVSLGLNLLPGRDGLVSHASLAPGAVPLSGDESAVAQGPLGAAPLRATSLAGQVDLRTLAAASTADGATRSSHLARYVQLLRRRGPAWLGLDAGAASAELLALLATSPQDAWAVTWWDRTADDNVAQDVFVASTRARRVGLPHRVLGLREALDGSSLLAQDVEAQADAGSKAAADAVRGLVATWGLAPEAVPPYGTVLDRALPSSAVLWLGCTPRPPRALGALAAPLPADAGPRVWDLAQGARPLALPFSDRLLPLLG